MSETFIFWICVATIEIGLLAMLVAFVFLWRCLYWCNRVRELREQLRQYEDSDED